MELTEYTLKRVERAAGEVDDSNGLLGDILADLQALHLEACRRVKPDGAKLARKLFAWELASRWEVFHGAAVTYKNLLGREGLAEYRRLAEAEWEKVPALAPPPVREEKGERSGGIVLRRLTDEDRAGADEYGRRFRITSIMELLARMEGDTDALVRIKSRDLSSAYQFWRIAEIYRQAGRHDDALRWAERGREAFPKRTDERLRDFLADEYHRRGRNLEALELIRAQFDEDPRLATFQKLKRHVEQAGEDWRAWRERALALMRPGTNIERGSAALSRTHAWNRIDASTLVEALLWEEDVEAAWAAAQEYGCAEHLWLRLARSREKSHPEDAVRVYRGSLDELIDRKNNQAYDEAAERIRRIGRLMTKMKRGDEFESLVANLRARHKPKRNFIKLLDGVERR